MYQRSSTLKNMSVALTCQTIERVLRDRPILSAATEPIDKDGRLVYEQRPHYFTGRVWGQEFERVDYYWGRMQIPGRAVSAVDKQGSFHTCWNNYWIHDLTGHDKYASVKINADSCDDTSYTVDMVLGEIERIDVELSVGSLDEIQRLFGMRTNVGRGPIL